MTTGDAQKTLAPGPEAVDVTTEQDGGIMKEIVTKGPDPNDKPMLADKVEVHYIGTLTDGSKFDSSRDRGELFSFNLGKGEVIKGWDLGVASMCRGERAIFYIKSEYGYGASGSPPKIPGGATLVFDVELFDFHGEDVTKEKDKGVIKRTVVASSSFETPNDGAQVSITLMGMQNGKVFQEHKSFDFELGEGLELGIPRGVEIAVEKMKKDEVAHITVAPRYGFGSEGRPDLGIPGNAVLAYEVKLDKFEKSKESWQLDAFQKIEQAKIFKDKGTKHFKDGNVEIALNRYQKVVDFLEHEISLKGDSELERKSILQAGLLNLALCYLKQSNWIEARKICDKILELDPTVAKAWFRRGEANFALNDWDVAKSDYEKTFELDPENKAAKNKIITCGQHIKQQKAKEKQTFANMFDKFAAIDQKKEDLEKQKRPDSMKNIEEWGDGKDDDVNSIKVSGDINMHMDIDQAVKEDQSKEADE